MMPHLKSILTAALLLAAPATAGALETVFSKYKIQLYGQVKIDAIYDNHAASVNLFNEYLRYTTSASPQDKDFRMSARGSRLGFDVDAGDGVTAKIEGDFLGDTTSSNATARLRHAFMQAKLNRWIFIAGQTWHLTPLELPDTANDYYFGNAGCLWSRVPQLRTTYAFTDALNASVAVTKPTTSQIDDNATAAGEPGLQANAVAKLGGAALTLSGALGRIKNMGGNNESGRVELVDFGFNVPMGAMVTLNGQLWTGRNLGYFLGGIGQVGFGTSTVRANGGFMDMRVQPRGDLWFNAVYGIDDPKDDNIPNNSPIRNQTWMANANYKIRERLTVTFETAYNMTDYKLFTGANGRDKRSTMHYQLSTKFPF